MDKTYVIMPNTPNSASVKSSRVRHVSGGVWVDVRLSSGEDVRRFYPYTSIAFIEERV